jgi:DNA-binding NtrC family response regulator
MKDNSTSHAGVAACAQARGGTYPPHRILVVDDDIAVLQLCADVLSSSGYEVEAAEDGAAGWDVLHASSYDLLITDNNMPRVSGVELVKNLRSAQMTLPVVLASGTIPLEALNRNPSLQLAGTLLKPFTNDDLLDTVKKALKTTLGAREQIALVAIC